MTAIKKPRPIKYMGPTYRRELYSTALSFCPPAKPCRNCTYPVIAGYCCTYCGSSTP